MKKGFLFVVMMLFAGIAWAQFPANSGQVYNNRNFQYVHDVLSASRVASLPITNAWNADGLPKWYSLFVTATASGYSVLLEGSLDGVTWSTISTNNSIGSIVSNTNPVPALYLRVRGATIPANTSLTVTAVGSW